MVEFLLVVTTLRNKRTQVCRLDSSEKAAVGETLLVIDVVNMKVNTWMHHFFCLHHIFNNYPFIHVTRSRTTTSLTQSLACFFTTWRISSYCTAKAVRVVWLFMSELLRLLNNGICLNFFNHSFENDGRVVSEGYRFSAFHWTRMCDRAASWTS